MPAAGPLARSLRLDRRDSDGALVLDGELDHHSVVQALAQADTWLSGGSGPLRVDLAGIKRSDSAGVALLLEWVRQARGRGRELRFLNLPAQMRSLVHFFDLEDVLPAG